MATACGTAGAQATSNEPTVMFNGNGQAVMVDPLAAQMMMGTGVPLSRGQAGLTAASMASRMTGIGSGRASGVRGGATPGNLNVRELAEKRSTLRLPAGQASNYFSRYGRGTTVNVSRPTNRATNGRYYNRGAGFFPESAR
ncbi:MAG: hypothetical protein BGO49_11795 [Planctomycetales bacterium 71-10]|nr:MAG: hypothetical protein BGO49_11795 [Planctomycetales bacterium 71-10]